MTDRVLFKVKDAHQYGLWETDGTAAGTHLLHDGLAPDSITHEGLTPTDDGRVLFETTLGANSYDLWITDGTDAGTSILTTVTHQSNSADGATAITDYAALGNGKVLFVNGGPATPSGNIQGELWITDGTKAGTSLLVETTPATGASFEFNFSYGPSSLTPIGGGRALFENNDGINGGELWITDGTAAGTSMLKDINPGTGSSDAGLVDGFIDLGNGKFVFDAIVADAAHPKGEDQLWVTDGTAPGTLPLLTLGEVELTSIGAGKALFEASDKVHGYELWITDGTAACTAMVKDIYPGSSDSTPLLFEPLGNGKALFEANDGSHGSEPWVTDGTDAGTYMLADINPGPDFSQARQFTTIRPGVALFEASDPVHGNELWITNGTTAGTSLLKDIDPGSASGLIAADENAFHLMSNGKVLLAANDGTGAGLWITDGTAAGTVKFDDLNPTYPTFTDVGPSRILWAGGQGTDFNTAQNWVGGVVPAGAADVGIGAAFTVDVAQGAQNTLDSLQIGARAVLNLAAAGFVLTDASEVSGNAGGVVAGGGGTLTVGGTFANSGVIELSVPGAALQTNDGTVVLTGGGTVLLEGGAIGGRAGQPQNDLLINRDNTIIGTGGIGSGPGFAFPLTVQNDATIDGSAAAALSITAPVVNDGLLVGTGSGGLRLDDAIDNTAGTILASGDASVVTLDTGTVAGGSLAAANGGLLLVGADATLDGTAAPVLVSGSLTVAAGATLTLAGTISGGAIVLDGLATLADREGSGGPRAVPQPIVGYAFGDTLDLRGITVAAGATATLAGGTLTVANGGTDYSFQLAGLAADSQFHVRTSASGGVGVTMAVPPQQIVSTGAELNAAIDLLAFADAGLTYTIDLAADIRLVGAIDVLRGVQGAPIDIVGNGHTIDGAGLYDGFFVTAGTVTLSDTTLQNMLAQGSTGGAGRIAGGGGLGAGGALFIGAPAAGSSAGASVTLADVSFAGDVARGGAGGGANYASAGPGAGGGSLNGRYALGGAGAIGGGGNGSGIDGLTGAGFAGGGGGFGGGGGINPKTGGTYAGGVGGFGGGYSGPFYSNGPNGFGGGVGGAPSSGLYGHPGAGTGGDVFVQQGATLTVQSGTLYRGAVYGGATGSVNPFSQRFVGPSAGAGVFLQGNQVMTIDPGPGQTVTNSTEIADESGRFRGQLDGNVAGLMVTGGGTVVLSGQNSYLGATTVENATLLLSDNTFLGGFEPAALQLENGGTLLPQSQVMRDVTVSGEATLGGSTLMSGTLGGDAASTLDVTGGGLNLQSASDFAGTLVVHPGNFFSLTNFGIAITAALGTGTIQVQGDALVALDEGFADPLAFADPITGFNSAATLELGNIGLVAGATASLSGGTLSVVNGPTTYTFSLPDVPAGSQFNVGGNDSAVAVTLACFTAGTRILTATGEVPVEALRIGDAVATVCPGKLASVQWIGQRRVECACHPCPELLWPVRVRAGAFGHAEPVHDLLLSPDHAVYRRGDAASGAPGALVPVRYLINGVTVVQERTDAVHYFHIELDGHAVLLAEGLPAESYLETGNRSSFGKAGSAVTPHYNSAH